MISIIFPVFNEENNLGELYKRLDAVASNFRGQEFEFIFVDDCSADKTPVVLAQLHQRDQRVRTIRFARNCGSHAAIACGLLHCQGEIAVILAADLQDPPEVIAQLMGEWQKGNKIVWGVRKDRAGERTSVKLLSKLYYALMNWLTTVKMPPSGADIFLVDRTVIDAFGQVTEKHTSVFMALAWLGFKQSQIDYVKERRYSGQSKWTMRKKIKLTLDSLLAFSDIPIRYMSVLGLLTAFLGFIYAAYVLWSFVNGAPVEGWSSLMIAILVVGGVQMMMLGILGEYLWRTYDESRKRPRYVIESMLGVQHSHLKV